MAVATYTRVPNCYQYQDKFVGDKRLLLSRPATVVQPKQLNVVPRASEILGSMLSASCDNKDNYFLPWSFLVLSRVR